MDKIALLFGGRSSEHEISILSGASIAAALQGSAHELVKIAIDRDGKWHIVSDDLTALTSLDDPRIVNIFTNNPIIDPVSALEGVDFVFPALHGPYGEDGSMQGLLETLGIPYAGCGVTASALAMDKLFAKEILGRAGIPQCAFTGVYAHRYKEDPEAELARVERELGYPVFVKPANMGSSVGVSRASDPAELEAAIKDALRYDSRLIIEEEIVGREFEVSVTGNEFAEASEVGEIVSDGEFYDYDAKYSGSGSRLDIPARIGEDKRSEIRALAIRAYELLSCEGFARADFFMKEDGSVLVNELNTIPGFTIYSMFPGLWKACGIGYKELIERIICLGYERYNAKNNR